MARRRLVDFGCTAVRKSSTRVEPVGSGLLGRDDGSSPVADEPSACPGIPSTLSWRERQVLELVAAGRTNAEIAQELYLSNNTVKTYIRTAYRKVGARS